ncbi:MAG: Nramp family divalent metal transporter [Verrucomicrobiales bacterium]|nr:Nramp family divalent metal transporter [Verrucomicrobiales bacterium]
MNQPAGKPPHGDGGPIKPPAGLLGALGYMGPGLILSAAIVGSGELIATTTLGARGGFALLWVILLGCTVKVAVQLEFGRAAILHGKPTLQVWNLALPGQPSEEVGREVQRELHPPPVRGGRGVHWSVYLAAAYMLANLIGQGGVLGGAVQVGRFAAPGIPVWGWLILLVLMIGALIRSGRYAPVELAATVMNLVFLGTVFYCVLAIQRTDYALHAADLAKGLSFRLPSGMLALAVSAFGITGISAGEITLYPYWCLEKGYARWTGPREDSDAWRARARGWIRVMTVDAVVSMVVYTLATCGFFILGATVLRAQPDLKDGNEFILQLSAMFTGVLGTGARAVFMVCAFTVLFSTVFANAAGFSRVWADFFGLKGWIDWGDPVARRRTIAIVGCLFPVVSAVVFLLVRKPLLLVVLNGLFNVAFLAVVAWQTVRFRYCLTPRDMRPSRRYDVVLWISLLAIGGLTVIAAARLLASLHGG